MIQIWVDHFFGLTKYSLYLFASKESADKLCFLQAPVCMRNSFRETSRVQVQCSVRSLAPRQAHSCGRRRFSVIRRRFLISSRCKCLAGVEDGSSCKCFFIRRPLFRSSTPFFGAGDKPLTPFDETPPRRNRSSVSQYQYALGLLRVPLSVVIHSTVPCGN